MQWVRSEDNITDHISREDEKKYTWCLSSSVFDLFMSKARHARLPMPTVDAFAGADARLLPLYVSKYFDPSAYDVDFFSSDKISECVIWCNPPWHLMADVLSSIFHRKLRAYVLAPAWTHAPWYSVFLSRAIWKYFFKPTPTTFHNPFLRDHFPLHKQKTTIVVGFFAPVP